MGHNIYDAGKSIADLGKSDKPQKRYRLWERPETNRKLEKPKAIPAYLFCVLQGFPYLLCLL